VDEEEEDGGLSFRGAALYLYTAGNTSMVLGATVGLLVDVFGVDVSDGVGLAAWLILVAGLLCVAAAWALAHRDKRRGGDA
jgi:hypothetical protein